MFQQTSKVVSSLVIWWESTKEAHAGSSIRSASAHNKEHTSQQSNGGAASGDTDADWCGWDNILELLDRLVQDQQYKGQHLLARGIPQPILKETAPLVVTLGGCNPSNRINIRDLI